MSVATNNRSEKKKSYAADLITCDYLQAGGWKKYTPTITSGGGVFHSGATYDIKYRITDGTVHVKGTMGQTSAGTVGTGDYLIALPPGCTVANSVGYTSGIATLTNSGATLTYMGYVSTGGSSFTITLINTATATGLKYVWGNSGTVIATTGLDQATIAVSFDFMAELSPTCAALAGQFQ